LLVRCYRRCFGSQACHSSNHRILQRIRLNTECPQQRIMTDPFWRFSSGGKTLVRQTRIQNLKRRVGFVVVEALLLTHT
jgi:hypothetical protein